jgi:hypothetical protein
MQRIGAALAVIVVAVIVGLGVAPTAQARTYCGKVHTHYGKTTYTRKIYRLTGHVTCERARQLIKASMNFKHYGRPAKGWECVMLHARRPYDITCGSPRGAEDYAKAIGSILLGY